VTRSKNSPRVTLAILHAFDGSLTGRLRIGHSYLRL
jgi:hypothetical protein